MFEYFGRIDWPGRKKQIIKRQTILNMLIVFDEQVFISQNMFYSRKNYLTLEDINNWVLKSCLWFFCRFNDKSWHFSWHYFNHYVCQIHNCILYIPVNQIKYLILSLFHSLIYSFIHRTNNFKHVLLPMILLSAEDILWKR